MCKQTFLKSLQHTNIWFNVSHGLKHSCAEILSRKNTKSVSFNGFNATKHKSNAYRIRVSIWGIHSLHPQKICPTSCQLHLDTCCDCLILKFFPYLGKVFKVFIRNCSILVLPCCMPMIYNCNGLLLEVVLIL